MGTPAFAVPSLERLAHDASIGCDVALVICQPDRPVGRGQNMSMPEVKIAAQRLAIPVFQPEKLNTPEAFEKLRAAAPDLLIVAAYGKILRRNVLDLPPLGCVNVHASLLPRYRGAAPANWCIVRGERAAGVTIMRMEEGLDTGPMLLQRQLEIGAEETAGELIARLAPLGAGALAESIALWRRGELAETPQLESEATLAPILTKEDGAIDFAKPAAEVAARIRGMDPWPGAQTRVKEKRLLLFRASAVEGSGEAGTVLFADKHALTIACGSAAIAVRELQLEGKKRMPAADLLRGFMMPPGTRLG